jgi:hypothetical protein
MIKSVMPDILARVTMYLPGNGGKRDAIPPVQYRCPLSINGRQYDCRLLLNQIGKGLFLGETADIPIKFLCFDLVKDQLLLGAKFTLWEMRDFAEGTILEVLGTDHNLHDSMKS